MESIPDAIYLGSGSHRPLVARYHDRTVLRGTREELGCTAPRSARRVVPRSARGFPFPFPLTSGVMGIGNAEAITDAA